MKMAKMPLTDSAEAKLKQMLSVEYKFYEYIQRRLREQTMQN